MTLIKYFLLINSIFLFVVRVYLYLPKLRMLEKENKDLTDALNSILENVVKGDLVKSPNGINIYLRSRIHEEK